MTVRGNTNTLDKFVIYLETEYYDEYVKEGIIRGATRDGPIEKGYKDVNCYLVEGKDNYFSIDVEQLSSVFPTLKFEYIEKCDDGQSSSDYRICLNGKTVDYNEGNSLTFDDGCVEERCNLCNCKLDTEAWWDGKCYECIELMKVLQQ